MLILCMITFVTGPIFYDIAVPLYTPWYFYFPIVVVPNNGPYDFVFEYLKIRIFVFSRCFKFFPIVAHSLLNSGVNI